MNPSQGVQDWLEKEGSMTNAKMDGAPIVGIPEHLHCWHDDFSGISELAGELAGDAGDESYAALTALTEKLAGDEDGLDLLRSLESAYLTRLVAHEESGFLTGLKIGRNPELLLGQGVTR